MTRFSLIPRTTLFVSMIAGLFTVDLHGQACQGTVGKSVWVEQGQLALGNTIGGGAALAGRRLGLSVSYRHRDISADIKGDEAALRAALVFHASRVQLCPVLSLGGRREEWQAEPTVALTSTSAIASAGLGVGMELGIAGGFSLIPHVVGQYVYSGTYYQLDSSTDNDESGAVGGNADIELGVLARFKLLYGGFRVHWNPEAVHGYLNRWVVGIAF